MPTSEPVLVTPRGRILRLDPFLRLLPVPQLQGEPKMLWLQRLTPPDENTATYLHPIQDQWQVELLPAPEVRASRPIIELPFPLERTLGSRQTDAVPKLEPSSLPSGTAQRGWPVLAAIVAVMLVSAAVVAFVLSATDRGDEEAHETLASVVAGPPLSEQDARAFVDRCWVGAFQTDALETLEGCISPDFQQTCTGSDYCCGKSRDPLGRARFLEFYQRVLERPGQVSVDIDGVASTRVDSTAVQVTIQQYWNDGVAGCQAGARQFTVRNGQDGPHIEAMNKLPCRRVRRDDRDYERCHPRSP